MLRWPLTTGTALLAVALLAQPACARQEAAPAALAAEQAEELYRTGRYEEAEAALRNASAPGARALLARVLMEVGRYDDAVAVVLDGGSPDDGAALAAVPAELANVAGEVLLAMGRLDAAESLFDRAGAAVGGEALQARLNAALVRWQRGQREQALREFDAFIDIYNAGGARSADDLTAVATAVRQLGATDPALFQDAVRAYEEAGAADARHTLSRLLEGELFLEKYNSTEASALFREVLAVNPRHPRALLGLARARDFDGGGQALTYADSSLLVNPNSPDARAFRARLMIGLERYDSAGVEVERALAVNPTHVGALSMLGAVRLLRGDRRGFDEARRRALAVNPVSAEFDLAVAEMAAQKHRYVEAMEIARRGAALDSLSWSVRAFIGLAELRMGDVAAARTTLDVAFAGDPYNVWVKNTLDLLDTYPRYVTETTRNYELFLHGSEAALLSLYMEELAEEAWEVFRRRYGTEPGRPVRIKLYPRSADFSVRTVGMAGLGALGVAFGNILAMDSPSAREPGSFNWGSTLWHEIAHAFTLAAADSRMPRWLTEGISVLEERRARPGWGMDVTVDFIVALQQGLILPVSGLNAGFVRPTYPQQVGHAYYQASLVAEYIEAEHGDAALRRMLEAYGAGRSSDEVFRQVLRTEPAVFDERFDAWLRQRFATQLASIDAGGSTGTASAMRGGSSVGGPFVEAIRAARGHLDAGEHDRALQEAERARVMFPQYTGTDSPYRIMHAVHTARGDTRRAAEALRLLVNRNETDYDAHIALAGLLEELGQGREAADVLERAMYINPFDPEVHARMATLYADAGEHRKAVRERRAVLALDPVNRADALYRLAVALELAGDREEARRQVLRALEVAPNFADAQELLLRLRAGGSQ